MNKQNAAMVIIILGLVAYIFIIKTSNIDKIYILATEKQVACLENIVVGNKFEIGDISNPAHFKTLKIFRIFSSESDNEVRINYSSCLTSRYAKLLVALKICLHRTIIS